MRALIVAEQLRSRTPGGIGTYVRGLVGGLRSLDPQPDVTLWASRPSGRGSGGPNDKSPDESPDESPEESPDEADEADEAAGLGRLRCSRLPGRLLVNAWGRGLERCPTGYDVLHATSLAVPPPAGTPTSVMVHDLAWRQLPDAFTAWGRRWHEGALRRALQRASLLIVPSRQTADALMAGGGAGHRIEVVEEGCDHLPTADSAAARALLAQVGVTGGYLLTVCTLEPRKNLPRLIEAYRAARPRLPEPWPLVVAGPDGWGKRLRPEPGVVLTGAVGPAVLAGLYQQARLVVYVPLLEGFGLPPVEAMRACAPVVASPLPSTGGAAFEVDPTDVGAIADAMVAVSSDERLRAELVTAGLLRSAELTWEATARRHAELWSSMR